MTTDGGPADEVGGRRRSWSVPLAPLVVVVCLLASVGVLSASGGLPDADQWGGGISGGEWHTGYSAGAAPVAASQIGRLLERRARAVLDRDERGFLAVLAEDEESAGFRARQRAVFANLADVPLASWSYRLRGTGAFPLPASSGGAVAAEVELLFRIEGYDLRAISSTEYLTFSRSGGRWRIASDRDGERAGKKGSVQLWDLGRVHVLHGRRSLVLGIGDPSRLRRYAADVERAVPSVSRVWPDSWPGKVVLTVPRTLGEMSALLGAGAGAYRDMAAVTTGFPVRPGTGAPADRITVNPAVFARLEDFGRDVVLRHEVAHVATRRHTTAATPMWLSEGLADWIGFRDSGRGPRRIAPLLSEDAAEGRLPTRLPADADFTAAGSDGRGPALAYEMAWSACRTIAERYGQDSLVEFYRAAGEGSDRAGGVDRVMRDVLGVGVREFTRDWRADVAEELM